MSPAGKLAAFALVLGGAFGGGAAVGAAVGPIDVSTEHDGGDMAPMTEQPQPQHQHQQPTPQPERQPQSQPQGGQSGTTVHTGHEGAQP
jgi:hypothetical protein